MQVSSKQNEAPLTWEMQDSVIPLSRVTRHSRALTRMNCMAGREPAKRGHCTPDGPERPKEECCPSPAGRAGSWSAGGVCLLCKRDCGGQQVPGKCIVEECVHLCVERVIGQ